jgi:hypothetical protein
MFSLTLNNQPVKISFLCTQIIFISSELKINSTAFRINDFINEQSQKFPQKILLDKSLCIL